MDGHLFALVLLRVGGGGGSVSKLIVLSHVLPVYRCQLSDAIMWSSGVREREKSTRYHPAGCRDSPFATTPFGVVSLNWYCETVAEIVLLWCTIACWLINCQWTDSWFVSNTRGHYGMSACKIAFFFVQTELRHRTKQNAWCARLLASS